MIGITTLIHRHFFITSIFLLLAASNGLAAEKARFTLNGTEVTDTPIDVTASNPYELVYIGGDLGCMDVEWYLKKPGDSEFSAAFDSDMQAEFLEHRTGEYELKMTVRGFDGRWFFNLFGCNNSGLFEQKIARLQIDEPGFTQTKYPIIFVPGVLGYDDILGTEYFYRVGDAISQNSDQLILNISLDPWQRTEQRGADLANKILDFLIEHDPDFAGPNGLKVNIIAHSHGATTARMAARILAQQFGPNGKVASITTVAGPHYGTPTADGAQWALENWDSTGGDIVNFLIESLIGELGSALVSLASGHAGEYANEGILDVLSGFTQKGMVRFNSCYPSAGVPEGGSYFIESNLPGNAPAYDLPINAGIASIDDCDDNPAVLEVPVNVAATPDEAYGEGTSDFSGAVFGDGLGNSVSQDAPNAIRYFSFTGKGEWNTTWMQSSLDLGDPALLVINSLYVLPGERTEDGYFWQWLYDTAEDLVLNRPVSRTSGGYTKDSDAFIPVSSTKFGEYIHTYGPWNHVDEQNGLLGAVPNGPGDDDPITVYRNHANRLQNSGL